MNNLSDKPKKYEKRSKNNVSKLVPTDSIGQLILRVLDQIINSIMYPYIAKINVQNWNTFCV